MITTSNFRPVSTSRSEATVHHLDAQAPGVTDAKLVEFDPEFVGFDSTRAGGGLELQEPATRPRADLGDRQSGTVDEKGGQKLEDLGSLTTLKRAVGGVGRHVAVVQRIIVRVVVLLQVVLRNLVRKVNQPAGSADEALKFQREPVVRRQGLQVLAAAGTAVHANQSDFTVR